MASACFCGGWVGEEVCRSKLGTADVPEQQIRVAVAGIHFRFSRKRVFRLHKCDMLQPDRKWFGRRQQLDTVLPVPIRAAPQRRRPGRRARPWHSCLSSPWQLNFKLPGVTGCLV